MLLPLQLLSQKSRFDNTSKVCIKSSYMWAWIVISLEQWTVFLAILLFLLYRLFLVCRKLSMGQGVTVITEAKQRQPIVESVADGLSFNIEQCYV